MPIAYEAEASALSVAGPYVLTKILGKGSSAVVKLGRHHLTGQQAAVKIIPKSYLEAKPKALKRIRREIAILKFLKHPNITSLIDFVESDGHYAMVTEFVSGGDLFKFMEKEYYRTEDVLASDLAFFIFYQLVSAVEYCHACGIAHRDIKAENILIDPTSGFVKIADFGLANFVAKDELMETSCGSLFYASPEIIRGDKYDGPAADVWSLGILVYLMATNNFPFMDENSRKTMELILSGKFSYPNTVDPRLRDMIELMLQPNYADRITLTQLKNHPWWIANCEELGLNPSGIVSSPRSQLPVVSIARNPDRPPKMSSPGVCLAVAQAAVEPPRRKSSAKNMDDVQIEDFPSPRQPGAKVGESGPLSAPMVSADHPLLTLNIREMSDANAQVKAYSDLQALVKKLANENNHLRTACGPLAEQADVTNPLEMVKPVEGPLDPEVMEFIVKVQGWEDISGLHKNIRKDSANMTKSFYKLLLDQKRLYGSLKHLTPNSQAANQKIMSKSTGGSPVARPSSLDSLEEPQMTSASQKRRWFPSSKKASTSKPKFDASLVPTATTEDVIGSTTSRLGGAAQKTLAVDPATKTFVSFCQSLRRVFHGIRVQPRP